MLLSLPVVLALHAFPPMEHLVLTQKIEVIRGPKRATTKPVTVETTQSTDAAKAQELDRKAAALDSRAKALEQREKALAEQEADAQEKERARDEKQKALQKKIEKIGRDNEAAFGAATDALSGE